MVKDARALAACPSACTHPYAQSPHTTLLDRCSRGPTSNVNACSRVAVPVRIMAQAEQSTPSSTSTSPFSLARLKEGLKKYGRTGIYVYLGISFSITAGWYVAITRNVDVKKILGIKDDPNRPTSWVESLLIGKGSNLALAILCSKFCVPIKIPMAVAVTPYVHRWSEQVFKGFAFKSR